MEIVDLVPPDVEPVDLALTKQHIRVDIDDDDDLIEFFITGARRFCEQYCNRSFITQTKGVWYDWPEIDYCYIKSLPVGPVQSVESVATYDEDGTSTPVDSSYYYMAGNRVIFKSDFDYPSDLRFANSILFRVVVGYGDDPEDVPFDIRQAILKLVGHMYQNREAIYDSVNGTWTKDVPFDVTALLQAYREYYL